MFQTNEPFAALSEESIAKFNMKTSEVISTEIVRIGHNFVVMNVGLKSEALASVGEFLNDQSELEVQVSDYVSVVIDVLGDGYGNTILSRNEAKRLISWLNLEKALEFGEVISGTVTGKIKDGLTVIVSGIRTFLPDSLVDVRSIKDVASYEGETPEFKVIKPDRKRNDVVLLRYTVAETTLGKEHQKLVETLRESAIVNGIVKNVTDYGTFADLGGTDGPLRIIDLTWRCMHHLGEVPSVGQEITAKIFRLDQEKGRVSLGVKQLGEDSWIDISRRYLQNTRLFGKVTNLTDYGTFVEIEVDIGDLVHISEMDWTNENVAPSKVVQLGDGVEVMILDIDEDKRRISLDMKQCKANPWGNFVRNHKKSDKLADQIKSITDFGVLIGLPGSIDGLMHLPDLSQQKTGGEAVRRYKEGNEMGAMVLATDVDKECISPGIRQLPGDPFNNFVSTNNRGSVVQVTIKTVSPKGVVVQLADSMEGCLRASKISSDRMENACNVLKGDETMTAMIVNIDRKLRGINVSVKAKDSADQQEVIQKFSVDTGTADTTSLGVLLKAKLSETNQ